jgi:hypothetical protein
MGVGEGDLAFDECGFEALVHGLFCAQCCELRANVLDALVGPAGRRQRTHFFNLARPAQRLLGVPFRGTLRHGDVSLAEID